MKNGDKIVALANLINMREMARKRNEAEKRLRLAIWKQAKLFTDLMTKKGEYDV